MKCLKNLKTGNIIRVDDKQAYQMAGSKWQYVPKSEWKAAIRTPVEPEPVKVEEKEETTTKKLNRRK